MRYYNEDSGIFSDDDDYFEEHYEMAENAEYTQMPLFGSASPTYTWQELEGAYKKLNLTREPVIGGIPATPDDWLDTVLWIKSLKEAV